MNPNIDEIFETLSENTLEKVFKLMGESKVFRANIDTKKLAVSIFNLNDRYELSV
jgi:hypothetical protein